MRISPTLLLMFLFIFVFAPSIQDWIMQGDTDWYRPYLVWLGVIIFTAWSVWRQQSNDL